MESFVRLTRASMRDSLGAVEAGLREVPAHEGFP